MPRPYTFSDSSYTFVVKDPVPKKTALSRKIRNSGNLSKTIALKEFLDSSGYFHAQWDTLSNNTITISAGQRSQIDTIIINSTQNIVIDSIVRVKFPFPYDAGKIGEISQKTVHFFARKGYPFAKAALQIKKKPEDNHHLNLYFQIETDQLYSFGPPLLIGDLKTKKRILQYDIATKNGLPFNIISIEQSQQRLLSREYINSVNTGSPKVIEKIGNDTLKNQRPHISISADSREKVAIPFSIEDKSGLGLNGALTFQSESENRIIGLLDLSLLNIFGTGESAMLTYKGEKNLQQFEILVSKPWIFGIPLFVGIGFGLEIKENDYGYLHGLARFLTELKPQWQAGMAFKGHEASQEATEDSSRVSWRFYGADFILLRKPEPYRVGQFSRHLTIETGTGIADKKEKNYTRWHLDFSAGTHVPVYIRQAIAARMVMKNIFTEEKDLAEVEMYRIGGYNSVRGYTDNEFPFRLVGYGQFEYLFYFSETGSAFIFIDGGIGFKEKVRFKSSHRTDMMGYGIGIRVPTRIGTASVAWARNYEETRGFGRIHIRFQNPLASETNWQ